MHTQILRNCVVVVVVCFAHCAAMHFMCWTWYKDDNTERIEEEEKKIKQRNGLNITYKTTTTQKLYAVFGLVLEMNFMILLHFKMLKRAIHYFQCLCYFVFYYQYHKCNDDDWIQCMLLLLLLLLPVPAVRLKCVNRISIHRVFKGLLFGFFFFNFFGWKRERGMSVCITLPILRERSTIEIRFFLCITYFALAE